jgi:hypothetical protein
MGGKRDGDPTPACYHVAHFLVHTATPACKRLIISHISVSESRGIIYTTIFDSSSLDVEADQEASNYGLVYEIRTPFRMSSTSSDGQVKTILTIFHIINFDPRHYME